MGFTPGGRGAEFGGSQVSQGETKGGSADRKNVRIGPCRKSLTQYKGTNGQEERGNTAGRN